MAMRGYRQTARASRHRWPRLPKPEPVKCFGKWQAVRGPTEGSFAAPSPPSPLATITGKKAEFRSLGDTWADTTTSHGRLMLTVLAGLADDADSAVMRRDTVGAQA